MEDRYEYLQKTRFTDYTNKQAISHDSFRQAYIALEYKYRQLSQEYNRLNKQFHSICEQASYKIVQLDQDADRLLKEKIYQIESLNRKIKDLQNQNYSMKIEKDKILKQTDILRLELGTLERDIRDEVYANEQRYKSIIDNKNQLQSIIYAKNQEIESLKISESNIQNKCIYLEDMLKAKDNDLMILGNKVQEMEKYIASQKIFENQVRDTNYSLKKQVQDLKQMFIQAQNNLRNCQGCFILKRQNQRLMEQVNIITHQCVERKRQVQQRSKFLSQQLEELSCQNRWLKRQLDETRNGILKLKNNDRFYQVNKGSFKESIAERCRSIIESRY